jgi:hypothetical protein
MFISKHEKEEMRISIRSLQAQVKHLLDELREMKLSRPERKPKSPIVRTEEAPWGYKKDNTPRKRPGRPFQSMEVGS